MPTNDFLTFAASGGANVISQADYAAAPTLATGFQSGLAPSASVNKPIRQASIMAAVLAQFIADETGANSVDDGTTATLLANLKTAIIRAGGGRPGHTYTTNDWAWIDEPGGLIIQWGIFSIQPEHGQAAGPIKFAVQAQLDILATARLSLLPVRQLLLY